jgi:taurine dioxygenase
LSAQDIRVEPINGAFGATVSGLDCSQDLDEAAKTRLLRAFHQHALLIFRDQDITLEQQVAFARLFGDLYIHPLFEPLAGHPEVLEFRKEPEDETNVGGGWHADLTCFERPPAAGLLRVSEPPASGGDTLFADMGAAYDALSPKFRSFLHGLTAVHTSAKVFGPWGKYARGNAATRQVKIDANQHARHPVVRTHAVTGRKSLFVNRAYTIFIDGLAADESAHLLEFLYAHAVKGEFTTRLRWRKDTMALWDNRCTLHYALNDYPGQRRVALRVTVAGEAPLASADRPAMLTPAPAPAPACPGS